MSFFFYSGNTENLDWKVYDLTGLHIYHPTEQKISAFNALKKAGGNERAISDEAIEEALKLHSQIFFQGFTEADAFPGFKGEIQIVISDSENDFEFTRESDGKWTFVHDYKNDDIEFLEDLSFDDIYAIASELKKKICGTSRFLGKTSGTNKRIASVQSHSIPQATVAESQSLNYPASSPEILGQYVITSGNIIAKLPMNALYSGSLMMPFYRQAHSWCRFQAPRGMSAIKISKG